MRLTYSGYKNRQTKVVSHTVETVMTVDEVMTDYDIIICIVVGSAVAAKGLCLAPCGRVIVYDRQLVCLYQRSDTAASSWCTAIYLFLDLLGLETCTRYMYLGL